MPLSRSCFPLPAVLFSYLTFVVHNEFPLSATQKCLPNPFCQMSSPHEMTSPVSLFPQNKTSEQLDDLIPVTNLAKFWANMYFHLETQELELMWTLCLILGFRVSKGKSLDFRVSQEAPCKTLLTEQFCWTLELWFLEEEQKGVSLEREGWWLKTPRRYLTCIHRILLRQRRAGQDVQNFKTSSKATEHILKPGVPFPC